MPYGQNIINILQWCVCLWMFLEAFEDWFALTDLQRISVFGEFNSESFIFIDLPFIYLLTFWCAALNITGIWYEVLLIKKKINSYLPVISVSEETCILVVSHKHV